MAGDKRWLTTLGVVTLASAGWSFSAAAKPPGGDAREKLVLIEASDGHVPPEVMQPGTALGEVLGRRGRFAIADPDLTSAGARTLSVLANMGVLQTLARQMSIFATPAAVVEAVASHSAVLGVTGKDAAITDPRVRIMGAFEPQAAPATTARGWRGPR